MCNTRSWWCFCAFWWAGVLEIGLLGRWIIRGMQKWLLGQGLLGRWLLGSGLLGRQLFERGLLEK